MIKKINTHETKTHLSRILAEVESGMEVIICRSGKPVAKIVPIEKPQVKRQPGSAIKQVQIGNDFDAPLPENLINSWIDENPD